MELSAYIIFINILLALFNMLPIPPLDGSKILSALLPWHAQQQYNRLMQMVQGYGIFVFFLIIFIVVQVLWAPLFSAVLSLASTFAGLSPIEFYSLLR
ncbi:MAG: site-2 protease family protein [Candidatus Paceibacterota bacterium]